MSVTVRLAISTCPNDTYAFAGILTGAVESEGLSFEVELLDIAELNRRLFEGDFDVAKVSFHAALFLSEHTLVLPVGAALGFGVGPLLLSARPGERPDRFDGGRPARVLCPGRHTTATMLYRLFYPEAPAAEQVVFSDIMPALCEGRADFGVCIHEGRFTYADQGLACVEDLGERWERTTGSPLPLGGIVGRRRLGADTLSRVSRTIARSIAYADAHRDAALSVMRAHAQELSDDVIWSHVSLYVNDMTRDLGPAGRSALLTLHRIASEARVVGPEARPLTVLDSGAG